MPNTTTTPITPGVYLVDKPEGPSSHTLVNYFRRLSGIKRVGHTGTLDPLASGLLIILVGREFTKLQSQYLKKDKTYLVTAKLGFTTDSYDRTGQVTSRTDWKSVSAIEKATVEKALKEFRGCINQTVPIFSAVKIAGQKLYDKARRGESVTLPSRQVTIHQLKLISFKKDVKNKNLHCTLEVACSSGTYIRSLVHDLGRKLGVGAHVTSLRRTKIDKFHVKKAMVIDLAKIKIKKDPDILT